MTRAQKCPDRASSPAAREHRHWSQVREPPFPPMGPQPWGLSASPPGTIPQDNCCETASKNPVGWQKHVGTDVRQSDRGQQPQRQKKQKRPLARATSKTKKPDPRQKARTRRNDRKTGGYYLATTTNKSAAESRQDGHYGARLRNRRRRANVNVVEQNVVVPGDGRGGITLETHTQII